MWRDKHVLILGGNGFIGRTLVRLLHKKGYEHITSASRREVRQKIAGVEYFSGVDITRPETIEPLIAKADVVLNLAGLVSFSQKDRLKLLEINAEGAKNVLDACAKNKNLFRFIHVSSSASFGFGQEEITEETQFDWSGHKNLVYSYSKFLANEIVHQSSIPTNILYPTLVLGPGNQDSTGKFFEYVRNKKKILVPSGSNSVIDVRDVAAAIELVLQSAPPKENYILSTQSVSFEKLFERIIRVLGQDTRISVLNPFWGKVLPWVTKAVEFFGIENVKYEQIFLGFQHRRHSNRKLRSLGFHPQYFLDQTLRDFLKEDVL